MGVKRGQQARAEARIASSVNRINYLWGHILGNRRA